MLACLTSSGPERPSYGPPGAAPGEGWRLVFADDFSGSELDSRRWTTCYWWDDQGCTNANTGEKQWYLPRNVTVGNGTLRLIARRERVQGTDGRSHPYTSGMVTTGRSRHDFSDPPRFAFTYGHAVARMRMPAGRGLWPAFWLLPTTHESRPEIDVVEVAGQEPRRLTAHVHYIDGDGEKQDPGHAWIGADSSAGWHDYGVTWSPDEITWTVDGEVTWRFTSREYISREPMYLLLNLAVAGEMPGDPDSSTRFPAELEVDFVRVWQKDGLNGG